MRKVENTCFRLKIKFDHSTHFCGFAEFCGNLQSMKILVNTEKRWINKLKFIQIPIDLELFPQTLSVLIIKEPILFKHIPSPKLFTTKMWINHYYTLKNNWQVLLSIWLFLKSTRKSSQFEKWLIDFKNTLSIFLIILSCWNCQIDIQNCHFILREIREKFGNDNIFVNLTNFLVIFCMLYTSQEIDASQFLSVL